MNMIPSLSPGMKAMPNTMPLRTLSATGATMTYGSGEMKVEALRGVSLTARPGEVLMVRGPSGSGKTTLLQLLGALKAPTAGRIEICGTTTTGLKPAELKALRARHIGFVFQLFNLFPTLKAWENVATALDLVGIYGDEAEERSRALLQRLGLAERAGFYPAQLSGGQRQRVAIARALAHDPSVILADEPTAALDGKAGAAVTELLCQLAHAEKRIVVIVTHDARVEAYADRIVTIEDGLLIEDFKTNRPSAEARHASVIQNVISERAS